MDGTPAPERPGNNVEHPNEAEQTPPRETHTDELALGFVAIERFLENECAPQTPLFAPEKDAWPKRWKNQDPELTDQQHFILSVLKLDYQSAEDVEDIGETHVNDANQVLAVMRTASDTPASINILTTQIARRIGYLVADMPYYVYGEDVSAGFDHRNFPHGQQIAMARREIARLQQDPELFQKYTTCFGLLMRNLSSKECRLAELATGLTLAQIRYWQDMARIEAAAINVGRYTTEETMTALKEGTVAGSIVEPSPDITTLSAKYRGLSPYRHNPSKLVHGLNLDALLEQPYSHADFLAGVQPAIYVPEKDRDDLTEPADPEFRTAMYDILAIAEQADARFAANDTIRAAIKEATIRYGYGDTAPIQKTIYRAYTVACHLAGVTLEEALRLEATYADLGSVKKDQWPALIARTVKQASEIHPEIFAVTAQYAPLIARHDKNPYITQRFMRFTMMLIKQWQELELLNGDGADTLSQALCDHDSDTTHYKKEPGLNKVIPQKAISWDKNYSGTEHLPIEEIWGGPFDISKRERPRIKPLGKETHDQNILELHRRVREVKGIVASAESQIKKGSPYVVETKQLLKYLGADGEDDALARVAHRARHAAFSALGESFTMYATTVFCRFTETNPFIKNMRIDALAMQQQIMANQELHGRLASYLPLIAAEGDELDTAWLVASMTIAQYNDWKESRT